jgi:hypothetical protein
MPGVTNPGYRGRLLYGNAGSTAGTQPNTIEDLNYNNPDEFLETTTRGNGSSVPKKSHSPVAIDAEITWSMFNKTGDAALIAFLAAARAKSLIALRTLSHDTGTGFDGDCHLTVSHEMTLKGGKFNFSAKPCDDLRDWQPNV